MTVVIRYEQQDYYTAITELNDAAFHQPNEGAMIAALRKNPGYLPALSLVALCHPKYYPRFGFKRASGFGIRPPLEEVPDEAFLILELTPQSLQNCKGIVE